MIYNEHIWQKIACLYCSVRTWIDDIAQDKNNCYLRLYNIKIQTRAVDTISQILDNTAYQVIETSSLVLGLVS